MTAEQILQAKEPGDIFTGDEAIMKAEYRELAKKWHPDAHADSKEATKKANEVTARITILYHEGLKMLQKGDWKKEGFTKFTAKDGKIHQINYYAVYDFELGRTFISDSVVMYIFPTIHKKFFDNMIKVTNDFKYSNDEMKKEFERYLPKVLSTFETKEDEIGVVVSKTPDLFLLRDVLNYYNGAMPDRHVAWIISRLMNLVCFINFNGLCHNGISLDTYFISPSLHSGSLLGGWWYSVASATKMIGTTNDIYALMPPASKTSKMGFIATDLECVRAIGRELLGDKNGTYLSDRKAAPEPFIEWLRSTPRAHPNADYEGWSAALTKSYGPRKFIPLELTRKMIYNK